MGQDSTSNDILAKAKDFYRKGLYLQALEVVKPWGDIRRWKDTEARILGARLASNLGAPRLGHQLIVRAWRDDREQSTAVYYYARTVLERRGPLAAWAFLREHGEDLDGAGPRRLAEWWAFHGCVCSRFRDFQRAEDWFKRALACEGTTPWVHVERSYALETEDRWDDALEAVERARESFTWYRPAVQRQSYLLHVLNRDREAEELLVESLRHLECSNIVIQLAMLYMESRAYEKALAMLEQYDALAPMQEKDFQPEHSMRADCLCFLGRIPEAIAEARQVDSPFFKQVTENLEKAEPEDGVMLLDVPFVQQHHMTCGPATLSAISGYWKKRIDHLALVEKICYDGTPSHYERNWAEENGYVVREFKVTWENALGLIDRGVPFTLSTREVTSAHLQAVVGYDARRKTLFVRDPGRRIHQEYLGMEFLEQHRSTGPHGMVILPEDQKQRIADLDLEEADLYDAYYELQSALEKHDRERAQKIHDEMTAKRPDGRITHDASYSLARYDADLAGQLHALDALQSKFKDNQALMLSRLGLLQQLSRMSDQRKLLRECIDRDDCHPIFWQRYASEIRHDAQQHSEAFRYLHKSIRCQPSDPQGYHALAGLLWSQLKKKESHELYRIAACLDDKEEWYAITYFRAARHLGLEERALEVLKERFDRYGERSGGPLTSYVTALCDLGRPNDGLKALEAGVKRRPEDGALLLFAADHFSRHGQMDRAKAFLESARPHASRLDRLEAEADLAGYMGENHEALKKWLAVLEEAPLLMKAHGAVVGLLRRVEGKQAVLEHLEKYGRRFPMHYDIHVLWAEWLHHEDPKLALPVLHGLIENHPEDPWANRELAICHDELGEMDEALKRIELGRKIDPNAASAYSIRAHLKAKMGLLDEAREDFKAAIRLNADFDSAIHGLVHACHSHKEQTDALSFVVEQLHAQAIIGDGVLAYRRLAVETLENEETLKALEELLEKRPRVWQVWSSMLDHLVVMNRFDEAVALGRKAVDRFPLNATLWIDLANAAERNADVELRIETLQRASELRPSWSYPMRTLAGLHADAGRFDEAIRLVERATANAPADGYNHGMHAEMMWKQGQRPEALEKLKHALVLETDYEWAWRTLDRWGQVLGEPDAAKTLARELTKKRGGESDSWMNLAKRLNRRRDLEERLEALEQAARLSPRDTDVQDYRMFSLTAAGRYDEALAVAGDEVWKGEVPAEVSSRAAWVLAERGDFEDAIAAMEKVVVDAPQHFWSWERLAEWNHQRMDLKAFRHAAEQLVRIQPGYSRAWTTLAMATWEQKEKEETLKHIEQAVKLNPLDEDAWDRFRYYASESKQGERVIEAATELTKSQPGEVQSWLVLSRALENAGRLDDQLEALDKVIELDPGEEDAYDMKARLLADAGRYDEALKACRPGWKEDPPLRLLGREAWVIAESGDVKEAIKRMEGLLKEARDYLWGWYRLADWYAAEEDWQGHLRAADELIRLEPSDPVPYGYRGHAHSERKQRGYAKKDFARALQLAPDYFFAGYRLFDLHFEDKEFGEARRALETMAPFDTRSPFFEKAASLYVETKDEEGMKATLERLFREEVTGSNESFTGIMKTCCRDKPVRAVFMESLDRILDGEEAGDGAARMFVVARVQDRKFREIYKKLGELKERRGLFEAAARQFMSWIGEQNEQWLATRLIKEQGDAIKTDTELWGWMGYALSGSDNSSVNKALVDWCADWASREGIEPWMFSNFVLAYAYLGNWQEVERLSNAAVQMPPDHTTPLFHIWYALTAGLAGNRGLAQEQIKHAVLDESEERDFYKSLLAMAQAVVGILRTEPDVREHAWVDACDALRRARKTCDLSTEPLLKRLYRKSSWHVATRRGGLYAYIWYLFHDLV